MLHGAGGLEALLSAARERGMDSIALTDQEGLYGAVPFSRKARDAGIRPLLGAELRCDAGGVTCLVHWQPLQLHPPFNR